MEREGATPAPAPASIQEPGVRYYLPRVNNIELYVILSAGLLTFLVFFGSFRRRCRSKLFKVAVWTAHVLSGYMISYIMGQMQSAERNNKLIKCITRGQNDSYEIPYKMSSCAKDTISALEIPNEVFAIWACFLLLVRGSADSMSAFSIGDNENKRRYAWQILVQTYWLGWLIGMYIYETGKEDVGILLWELGQVKYIYILLCVLYLVIVYKARERVRSFRLASKSALARNIKLMDDFMGYEHELSSGNEIDPAQMKGYNYLVRGESDEFVTITQQYTQRLDIDDNEVITIHKIWQCKGKLLAFTGDPDDRVKDICLSFALYRLLCRRFAGYSFHECSHDHSSKKAWRFVRYGLLAKEDDYERAFRVIEVELDFIFDLFYTKYASIFEKGRLKHKIFEFISVILFSCWLAISLLIHYKPDEHDIDILLTGIVIAAIVSLEVVQIAFIIFSDWSKVILLCKYVQKPSWQESKCIEKMIKFVCGVSLFKPWERKIDQYSLLKSFNYRPSKWLYNDLTRDFIDRPHEGRKESAPIKLPAEVKKAVIHSLKNMKGRKLSNGLASLSRNIEDQDLIMPFEACKLETSTHVIMVWHIATTLCEFQLSKSAVLHPQSKDDFIVATSLSKYCAYLVAFAPGFLPEHSYVSKFILERVIIETRRILNNCKSMEKIFEKMMSSHSISEDIIIKNGVELGKYLIKEIESEEKRWKILADFWAEMMLFVAPSDNANIHAEHLAQGGEFVTHLWALLSHAGIFEREVPVRDSPNFREVPIVRDDPNCREVPIV